MKSVNYSPYPQFSYINVSAPTNYIGTATGNPSQRQYFRVLTVSNKYPTSSRAKLVNFFLSKFDQFISRCSKKKNSIQTNCSGNLVNMYQAEIQLQSSNTLELTTPNENNIEHLPEIDSNSIDTQLLLKVNQRYSIVNHNK